MPHQSCGSTPAMILIPTGGKFFAVDNFRKTPRLIIHFQAIGPMQILQLFSCFFRFSLLYHINNVKPAAKSSHRPSLWHKINVSQTNLFAKGKR
jgi:hypothetical protein